MSEEKRDPKIFSSLLRDAGITKIQVIPHYMFSGTKAVLYTSPEIAEKINGLVKNSYPNSVEKDESET